MESEAAYESTWLNGSVMEAGKGHLQTQFDAILGNSMSLSEPCIRTLSMNELPSLLGSVEIESMGVYIPVLGDVQGGMMFICTSDAVVGLLDALELRSDRSAVPMDVFDRLTIGQIAARMGDAFLGQMHRMHGMVSYLGAPVVMMDMAGSILDTAVINACQNSDHVLAVEFFLVHGLTKQEFSLWLIPDFYKNAFV
ncbi:MAG: hypothetical protein JXA97_04065 [Anaerolineales bacterium]|nr:hypothetical protein [Anaerolineales bacterium]